MRKIVIAKIYVDGVTANVSGLKKIPKGIVGGTIEVTFGNNWTGLAKTAVFQGAVSKDVLVVEKNITIPAECVDESGHRLKVGFYGVADETLVIPTIWAELGTIQDATDPSGDTSTDPSLPVWAQLHDQLNKDQEEIKKKLDAAKLPEAINTALAQAKESGEFDGPQGPQGPKGEKGIQGEKGDPGIDGKDASPVVCTTSGVSPQVTDAANRNILNLTVNDGTDVKTVKVIGKNLFNRHYTKSETNIGVTVEWDAENQEFVFNGTTTSSGDIKIVNPFKIEWNPGEKYTVSVRKVSGIATLASGTNATTYGWGIFQDGASKFIRGATGNSSFLDIYNFTGTAFALDTNRNYIFYFQCWRPGTVFKDYRVKIQIEKGTTLTDWEVYREESTTFDDVTSLELQKGFNTIVTEPPADISVEYVADTKLYIDNKFAELAAIAKNT